MGTYAPESLSRSEVSTALKRTVHFKFPAVGTIESMYAPEQIQRSRAAILLGFFGVFA